MWSYARAGVVQLIACASACASALSCLVASTCLCRLGHYLLVGIVLCDDLFSCLLWFQITFSEYQCFLVSSRCTVVSGWRLTKADKPATEFARGIPSSSSSSCRIPIARECNPTHGYMCEIFRGLWRAGACKGSMWRTGEGSWLYIFGGFDMISTVSIA